MSKIKKKWQKLNSKHLLAISKLLITFSSVLIFLAWLMFTNNNFFPKSQDSFVSKIMNTWIEIIIWPITLITLFILILPIWVTTSHKLLLIFLTLSVIIILFNFLLLFYLNINMYWVYWLVSDIISFFTIIFALFAILQKNKNK